MSDENYVATLDKAIDKILLAHRNSKIFLFLMTGPFLVALTAIKYTIKALVLYYLYLKRKKAAANKQSSPETPEPNQSLPAKWLIKI